MSYPSNMWLINEREFDDFTFTGGKVIYIVEEPKMEYKMHPAIITAGALLPPIDAIQLELDGNIIESTMLYEQYLLSQEADQYISIMIAAAFNQIPIGIMFGRDESNMQFPKMLMDFLYKAYGLVIGIRGKLNSYIEDELIPLDLAKLYMMNIIDYQSFMTKHPPLPIHDSVISKMAYDVNPIVDIKDFEHYKRYFEMVKTSVLNNGGKFLIDPLEAI